MSCRTNCPKCGEDTPKMWHDGDRWNCLCGWRGDRDDWILVDAMSRVLISWRQEQIDDCNFDLAEKLKPLGEIGESDVLIVRVATEHGANRWVARTLANLNGGKCNCCASRDHFTTDQIREIRLIRISVDES